MIHRFHESHPRRDTLAAAGLGIVVASILNASPARAHCSLTGLPACGCYVAGGAWPLPEDVGDLISTARKSLPAQTSCLQHRGLPYWQIQLQMDDPVWAHFVADLTSSPFFPPPITDSFKAQAWCTETVAFWHREAQLPRSLGYFTLWWLSTYVQNARQLRLWYETEESPGLLALFGYEGRGRWIGGSELDYDDFIPGVNGPCPGAYQAWEAYNSGTAVWEDSCFHSQVVDSMVIYRFGNAAGPVQRIDLRVVEGNASGGSFVDINGTSVARGKVRSDRWYYNVMDWTSLGDSSQSCGLTRRKIRGWGIDLDADGNPLCDAGKIHTVVIFSLISHNQPSGTDEPEYQTVNQVIQYFGASNGASKSVTTNASAIQTGGALPTPTTPWTIPQGPLNMDPSYIQVDLLAEHPLPVRGIVVDWKDGYCPLQYQVWWAGQNQQIHTATVSLPTGQVPPMGTTRIPIPTAFGPAPSYPVRYLRLVFNNAFLMRSYQITGLHYLFDFGTDDDNGGVLEEDAPVTVGVERPHPGSGALTLLGNAPNPFARSTLIEYECAGPERAELVVFDLAGRVVRRFNELPVGPGRQGVVWDGRDDSGAAVLSGTYFYRLRSGALVSAKKMLMLR